MKLYYKDIIKMIDASLLSSDVTLTQLDSFITKVKEYSFICCFTMPCYTRLLKQALNNRRDIMVGGAVGFPTGTDTTECKIMQTLDYVTLGCNELDMVMNIGLLKSEKYKEVAEEINMVSEVSAGLPIKLILEVMLLTDYEIRKACEIAMKSNVAYVKTGTGFSKGVTTLHHIEVIRETIVEPTKIKASGGIRDLHTLIEMYKRDVTRFGISINNAIKIAEEAKEYKDGIKIKKIMR